MKLKRCLIFAFSVLMLISSSGCSSLSYREYSVSHPHTEQYTEIEGSDTLRAENYTGIKDAILYFITEMQEEGFINLYNYYGDVSSDLARACLEVVRSSPEGAFLVDYIVHDYVKVVSHYELHISITYRRSLEDLESIKNVTSYEEAKEVLKAAYENLDDHVFLRFAYYTDWASGAEDTLNDVYYSLPQYALLKPQINVTVYPDEGLQRIVQVDFDYGNDIKSINTMRNLTANRAERILSKLDLTSYSDEYIAQYIYNELISRIDYDYSSAEQAALDENTPKNLSHTSYGALIGETAVSEGFALAYKTLCDIAGIDCIVVSGRRQGEPCCWNIIKINDDFYHVDCSAFAMQNGFDGFMRSDFDISEYYRWNHDNYPECS